MKFRGWYTAYSDVFSTPLNIFRACNPVTHEHFSFKAFTIRRSSIILSLDAKWPKTLKAQLNKTKALKQMRSIDAPTLILNSVAVKRRANAATSPTSLISGQD
jgi:hypothetical protein